MIDIKVLDTDHNLVGVIDTYESFIWTDRFDKHGDFELYTAFDANILDICRQNYYLHLDTSYHNMIVEDVEISSTAESGIKLIIKGRSLESILDRRIVWTQTTVSGNLINAVNVLMRDAFLKNSITDRIIPNFYVKKPEANFVKSDGTAFTIEKTQFTGDSIDVIFDNICETLGIGYRILFGYQMRRLYGDSIDVLNPNNNTWVSHTLSDYDLVFELYLGVDRSYVQNDRPYVVFSPGFDNIINTNYIDSVNLMKNVTLVLGEDQGNVRKRLIVGCGQGLDRRELYTDARDLRSSDYGTAAKYQQAMKQRGLEKLYENSRITSYEGEVEALRSFIYGEDFFMGDVVQISNEYGINGNARVVEWVRSESETGLEVYPTFSGIQIINDDIQEDDE